MYNTSDPVPQVNPKKRSRSEILRNVSVSAGALGVGYGGVMAGRAAHKAGQAADEWKKSAPSSIGRGILKRAKRLFRLSSILREIRFSGIIHSKYVPDSPYNNPDRSHTSHRRMRNAAMVNTQPKRVERKVYTADEKRVRKAITDEKHKPEIEEAVKRGISKEGLAEIKERHKAELDAKAPGGKGIHWALPKDITKRTDMRSMMHADIDTDITGIHAEFNKARTALAKKHQEEYAHAENAFPTKSKAELSQLKEKHRAEKNALQEGYEGRLGMRTANNARKRFKDPKNKAFMDARMKLSISHQEELKSATPETIDRIREKHSKEIENLKRRHSAQEHDIPRVEPVGSFQGYARDLSIRRSGIRRKMASELGYEFHPYSEEEITQAAKKGKNLLGKKKLVVTGKRAIIQSHRRNVTKTLPRPRTEEEWTQTRKGWQESRTRDPHNLWAKNTKMPDLLKGKPRVGLKDATGEELESYAKDIGSMQHAINDKVSRKIRLRGQASLRLEGFMRRRITGNVLKQAYPKGVGTGSDAKEAQKYAESEAEKILRNPHSHPLKAGGRRPQGILGDTPLEGEPLREAQAHLGNVKWGKYNLNAAQLQRIHQRLRWKGPVAEEGIRTKLLNRGGGAFHMPPPPKAHPYPNLRKLGKAGKLAGVVAGAAAVGYGISKLRNRNKERQFGAINDATLKAYVHGTSAIDRLELKLRRSGRKFARNHPMAHSAAKGYARGLMVPIPGSAEAGAAIGAGRHLIRNLPSVRESSIQRVMRKVENRRAINMDVGSGILSGIKLSDTARRKWVSGAALTGGIGAADATVSGLNPDPGKSRLRSAASGLGRGLIYGGVLAGSELALRKPLTNLAKSIIRNSVPRSIHVHRFSLLRRDYPKTTVAAVAKDRYIKKIREQEVNRHESNILKTGVAGAALGGALRGKMHLGKAAGIGAAIGAGTQAALIASNRKRRDQFGDSTIATRRVERAPYQAGAVAAGALGAHSLYKKFKFAATEEEEEGPPQFFRGSKWERKRLPRRYEEIETRTKRGGRLIRDVAAKATGKPLLDARGRERTPEWKKPWFATAALGTVFTGGVLAAKGLRSDAWRGATKSFIRKHPRVASAHGFVRGAMREMFGHSNAEGRKINKGLFSEITERVNKKMASRKADAAKRAAAAATEEAKRKAHANLRRDQGFQSRSHSIRFAETVQDWDIRDARGRSARVYAPNSQRRYRRPKKWHEKKSNRDLLAGAGLAGAASLGAGFKSWQMNKGKASTPKPSYTVVQAEREVEHVIPNAERYAHWARRRLSARLDSILNFDQNIPAGQNATRKPNHRILGTAGALVLPGAAVNYGAGLGSLAAFVSKKPTLPTRADTPVMSNLRKEADRLNVPIKSNGVAGRFNPAAYYPGKLGPEKHIALSPFIRQSLKPGALAHELGHANQSKLVHGYGGWHAAGKIGTGLGSLYESFTSDEDRAKKAAKISTAAALPMLANEVHASIKGASLLKKAGMTGARRLTPFAGIASYGAVASLPYLTYKTKKMLGGYRTGGGDAD